MNETVIRTTNLCKDYGKQLRAVDGVNLCVERGEIYGFLGPNGAGKTTTIGILLGLSYSTTGEVEVFGERVTPLHNKVLKKVGAMFGAPGFTPYLTGKENLDILARVMRVKQGHVKAVLDLAGLSPAAHRKVSSYSLGMKQRLALAAALLHQPELLILDEPTNGMDPVYIREFRVLLRSLAQSGVTIFLSSHLLHEVEQICDRVAVLHKGHVLYQGQVAQLQGNVQKVRVSVAQRNEAVEVLRDYPGVQVTSVNGDSLEVEGIASQEVIALLAQRGIYPSEVKICRAGLEDLFMQMIEEPSVSEDQY